MSFDILFCLTNNSNPNTFIRSNVGTRKTSKSHLKASNYYIFGTFAWKVTLTVYSFISSFQLVSASQQLIIAAFSSLKDKFTHKWKFSHHRASQQNSNGAFSSTAEVETRNKVKNIKWLQRNPSWACAPTSDRARWHLQPSSDSKML